MSKEAMNHAIDVLKDSQDYKMGRAMTVEAVEALEEALAKQEQGEPVAWMKPDALCDRSCMYACTEGFTKFPECATTPQQRTWVGLTDREKSNLWLESRAAIPRFHTYASLVEAKLKEKNT
jgi:hypothetical protein